MEYPRLVGSLTSVTVPGLAGPGYQLVPAVEISDPSESLPPRHSTHGTAFLLPQQAGETRAERGKLTATILYWG